jgi:hypothetical protein
VAPTEDTAADDRHRYWLMKAEPESRIEGEYDVKFSIDDLMAAETPVPWDGESSRHSILALPSHRS